MDPLTHPTDVRALRQAIGSSLFPSTTPHHPFYREETPIQASMDPGHPIGPSSPFIGWIVPFPPFNVSGPPFQRVGFVLRGPWVSCRRSDSVNCTFGSIDALVHDWTHVRIASEATMATGMPYGLQAMLKEGHSYFAGINEAVLKNIEACRGLARITRTSMGPAGATSEDTRNKRTNEDPNGSNKDTRADHDDLRPFQDRTSCW